MDETDLKTAGRFLRMRPQDWRRVSLWLCGIIVLASFASFEVYGRISAQFSDHATKFELIAIRLARQDDANTVILSEIKESRGDIKALTAIVNKLVGAQESRNRPPPPYSRE